MMRELPVGVTVRHSPADELSAVDLDWLYPKGPAGKTGQPCQLAKLWLNLLE